MSTVQSKSPFASKTLWANVVSLLVAILLAFGIDLGLDAEAQASIVLTISSLVNIALRFKTDKAIKS